MSTVDHAEVSRNIHRGKWFQLPMILVWGFMPMYVLGFDARRFLSLGFTWTWDTLFQVVGLGLMVVSMFQIYSGDPRREKLITTNVFRLTRHPMYHGMYIAALAAFFHANLRDPIFWLLFAVYSFLTLMAGWYQEKETLARWGSSARIYYDNTPRFIFEWPWFWIRFLPF